MKSKGLMIVVAVLALAFGFFVLKGKLKSGTNIKNEAGEIEKKIETVSAGIVASANLVDCPERYFEMDGGGALLATDCRKEPQGAVCSYYKEEASGQIYNLQSTSECSICKMHGRKGNTFNQGTRSYTCLGYESRECYQGMYQRKD